MKFTVSVLVVALGLSACTELPPSLDPQGSAGGDSVQLGSPSSLALSLLGAAGLVLLTRGGSGSSGGSMY